MEQRLILHCVDGDVRNRAELARAAFDLGHHAEVYANVTELIQHSPRNGIIFARDGRSPGVIAGVLEQLADRGIWLPLVATGMTPTTGRIVAAIKAGALDYLPFPVERQRLATMLELIGDEASRKTAERRRMVEARGRIASLSGREREVLEWLAEGSSNKAIARELDISPRTVEIHRANMMNKLGARHAAEAVRLRIEAQMEPPAMG
ncbi:response regulator transcription factor [Parerythrobacter aestuarii]|uniref:response regulator transcription factor n=1 Tax=Parerythrobacter aestuarii TaxID=3020909 RepID=UPI0024DEECB2|nr:LuxR C-terminal-related transcriptional regulator [Parerythrobacter aestuarii]